MLFQAFPNFLIDWSTPPAGHSDILKNVRMLIKQQIFAIIMIFIHTDLVKEMRQDVFLLNIIV